MYLAACESHSPREAERILTPQMGIARSEENGQTPHALLESGMHSSEQPVSGLPRSGAHLMVRKDLEQQVVAYAGRERYERRQGGEQRLRNGCEPGRIRSAKGEIVLQVPPVRGTQRPHHSKLMEFRRGNSDGLEHLVVRTYARGMLQYGC